MIFTAHGAGQLDLGPARVPCALGRGGVVAAALKREGDGASPAGVWPLRSVFYRPDRRTPPVTRLPLAPLARDDGWCDAPDDPCYNRLVRLPHAAHAEALWREDGLYDLIVVIGHNDAPVVPGAGSAIFLHLTAEDLAPTEGCVAVATADMLTLLALAAPGDCLAIEA